MAVLPSIAALIADINAKITTNGANLNTGARVNQCAQNIVDTLNALVMPTVSLPLVITGTEPGDISLQNSGVTAGAYTVNGVPLFTVTVKGVISTAVSAAITSDDIPDQSGIGFTVTDALLNLQASIVPGVTSVNGIGPGDITVNAEDIDVIDMVVITMGVLNNVLFLDGVSTLNPLDTIGNDGGGNYCIFIGAAPTYYSNGSTTNPITGATQWTDGLGGQSVSFKVQAYEGTVQAALQAAASYIGELPKTVEGTVSSTTLTVIGGGLGVTLTAANPSPGQYQINGPGGTFTIGKTILIPVAVDSANSYSASIDYASDSRCDVSFFDTIGVPVDPPLFQFTIRVYS